MFELRVLTGLHRGAALPLSGASWRIGSSDESDMVLYDPGISAKHCLLERQDSGWTLYADEGPLSDSEGHQIEHQLALQTGTPFALGHLWLCVVDAALPWQEETPSELPDEDVLPPPETSHHDPVPTLSGPKATKKAALPWWAKCSYLLLGVLLFLMVGSWMLQESAAMPSAPPPQDTRMPISTLPQLNSMLQTMLRERDLLSEIDTHQENNHVVLSGNIRPAMQKRLERMLMQFHQRYNTTLQIEDHTTVKLEKLPFRIIQVTRGPQANIVTSDGRRIFVGDEVNNLRLVSIDDHLIEFRGRQQIKVNW
ncbi:FHA domain-containing protein [Pectobacteriaceae bacterium C52]|nr:FHA domain-containing protein [Pectobacteriaceae bacterium C52]